MTRPDRRSFVAAIAASITTPVGLGAKECPPPEWTGIALHDLVTVPLEYERLPWLPAWGRKEDDFDVI